MAKELLAVMSKPVFEGWLTPSGRRNRRSYIFASLVFWLASDPIVIFFPIVWLVFASLIEDFLIPDFVVFIEVFLAPDTGWRGIAFLVPDIGWKGLANVTASVSLLYFALWGAFILFLLICNVLVIAQRLRDIEWSGWWALPAIILPIIPFVLWFIPGTQGENKYGPDPLSVADEKKQ